MLLTSHDLAEADTLADRIVVIDRGKVLADAPPAAIRSLLGGSAVRCRTGLRPAPLAAMPGVRRAEAAGADTLIHTRDAASTLRALLAADPHLSDLRVAEASLEDAIADLLAAEARRAA